MHIAVLTPEQKVFEGEVRSVKVPGASGEFEILNNHAPIVSALTEGRVRIVKENGEENKFLILKGFVEVNNNDVSLLVQGYRESDL